MIIEDLMFKKYLIDMEDVQEWKRIFTLIEKKFPFVKWAICHKPTELYDHYSGCFLNIEKRELTVRMQDVKVSVDLNFYNIINSKQIRSDSIAFILQFGESV
jgi:hypothetical protein